MKHTFTPAECEIVFFAAEDVITTSYDGGDIEIGDNGNGADLPSVDIGA